MMNRVRFKQKLASILFLFLVSGCSPLLNIGDYDQHHDQIRDSSFLVNQNCPLEFKNLNYCAELIWDQSTIRSNGLNSMALRFWRRTAHGRPVQSEGFELESSLHPYVWLWMDMSEGGHSSSEVRLSSLSGSSGEFAVDEVVFSMRGKWEIHVDLRNSAQQKVDESSISIWVSR